MIPKTSKKAAPGGEILPGAALFYGVLSPYWSVYWSVQKSNFEANSLQINIKKKFLISCEIRNFLVETTGLEPVTSCV